MSQLSLVASHSNGLAREREHSHTLAVTPVWSDPFSVDSGSRDGCGCPTIAAVILRCTGTVLRLPREPVPPIGAQEPRSVGKRAQRS